MLLSVTKHEIWSHKGIENIPEKNILRGLCVICKKKNIVFDVSKTPRYEAKLKTKIIIAFGIAWKTEDLSFPPISRWYRETINF